MNVATTEALDTDLLAPNDCPVLEAPRSLPRLQSVRSTLTDQQEAFLHDRFSTKLEDPRTGRWIRSWREEG